MNFSKCIPPCEQLELLPKLIAILQNIEKRLGYELQINSAYRTPAYESRMGRSGHSAHCLRKAVDISCTDDMERFIIITSALKHGVKRIGVYRTFIHIDIADGLDNKATDIIWIG